MRRRSPARPDTFTGRPAAKVTTSRIGSSVTAVPRSGCRAISSTGIAVNTTARNSSLLVSTWRRLSPSSFASTSATVALANSDGCRLNTPRSIQRREPPRTAPKNITKTSSPTARCRRGATCRRASDSRRPARRPSASGRGHGVELRPVDAARTAGRAVDHREPDATERDHAAISSQSMWK